MMGKLVDTKVYKMLDSAAVKLEGKLSVSYQQLNGGVGGLFNFVIKKEWNGLDLQITSSISEFPLQKDELDGCKIKITMYKNSPNETRLSIWRKDYLDKLPGFRNFKTGYKAFDKKIALKPSRNIERFIRKAFENPDLRNELIKDKYRTYTVYPEKGKMIIQRKSALIIKSDEMIIDEYNRFELLLNGLKEAHII